VDPEGFLGKLKREVIGHPALVHPFLERFGEGDASEDGVRTFAIQYYRHVRVSRLYLAAVISNCREDEGLANYQGVVSCFQHPEKKFDLFNRSPRSLSRHICRIMETAGGSLLVGTANQGLKLLHTATGQYEDLLCYNPDELPVYVRDIHHYNGDEYWIATESGIYIYNLATRRYTNLRKQYNNPYSLSDNAIYFLEKDKEGGMWAGTGM
jgi:hypothetical protein